MKAVKYILTVLLITTSLSLPAYAQGFWCGNPIAEFLDPNTVDAYHEFLVKNVVPELRGPMMAFDNNPDGDKGVTIYDPGRCWDGYTMLSCINGYKPDPTGPAYNAILIDMKGNLVKQWVFANSGVPMKLLPGGYVMGGTAPPAMEGHLTQMNWGGEKVWEVNIHVHHDHQREGNPVGYYVPGMEPKVDGGKTLILDHGYPDPNRTAHISDFPLIDDTIWEVDWSGKVLWQWNVWEHFQQMGFDDVAREGIKTIRVPFMDPKQTDWLHTNSASWLGPNKRYDQGDLRFHPDNIIFDCRNNNVSGIIARYDHPQGKWAAGDIIWKVGPDFSADQPEHKLGQVIGQHHVHMIPKGLPGEGNILMFDNGGYGGYGAMIPGSTRVAWPNKLSDYSRIIEFDPITLDIVWEYKQPKPTADYDGDKHIWGNDRKFFTVLMGNMQRLANGNTLICESCPGRVFEVTPTGEVVWEYISPYAVPGGFGSRWIYRVYRVPASWIPQGAGN